MRVHWGFLFCRLLWRPSRCPGGGVTRLCPFFPARPMLLGAAGQIWRPGARGWRHISGTTAAGQVAGRESKLAGVDRERPLSRCVLAPCFCITLQRTGAELHGSQLQQGVLGL